MRSPETDGTHATQAEPSGCGQACPTDAGSTRDPAWHRAASRARLLSWLSLAYMTAEGAIAIVAAVLSGSVALLGFGPGFGHRGPGQRHHLAVHRHPHAVCDRRGTRAKGRGDPYIAYDAVTTLLPRPRSYQLVGYRPVDLLADRHANPRRGQKCLGTQLASAATAGEAAKTCCAPTLPPRCWSVCWPILH
jgi:hypothetical protein